MTQILKTHSKAPILYITGGADYETWHLETNDEKYESYAYSQQLCIELDNLGIDEIYCVTRNEDEYEIKKISNLKAQEKNMKTNKKRNVVRKGVLMEDQCTNTDLWSELIEQKEISDVLTNWLDEKEMKINITAINPFRIVIHKVNRLKMVHYQQNGFQGASKCKYIALMWIPTNDETGMTPQLYNKLIQALQNSSYFCKKLNKDAMYISGPDYGQNKDKGAATNIFDLDRLQAECRARVTKTLRIVIAVHELATENVEESDDTQVKDKIHVEIDSKYESNANLNSPLLGNQQRNRPYLKSFGGVVNGCVEPASSFTFDSIYDRKSGLLRDRFVFAIVWLHVVENNKNQLIYNANNNEDNKNNENEFDLPAWTIMKKIHQQPYNNSLVYNIELFKYDECFENQDLVVDRKILWLEAALVFSQMCLLPLFIIFPPRTIIKIFNKKWNLKPRYRPVEGYVKFEDLDRIEQLPYDITALWGGCREYKTCSKLRLFLFRFISFIVVLLIWLTVFSGPFFYQGKPSQKNDVNKFLFFDCFGPLIFYTLFVFTITFWSCATRTYIWPKEHELLYFQLIVNRPIHRKGKGNQNIRRTDWEAVSNISNTPSILTTFIYAFRKGFLELKTPNQELLSMRLFKTWSRLKVFITLLINMILYMFAHNLENIEVTRQPIYISTSDNHYQIKLFFNITSVLFSLIFVCGFILLWETMFDRINRHLDTIKTLSNLLVRNTYSEYIKLCKNDNILSWLIMERFIKRKGMMLFSSLETPLFALGLLLVSSSAGVIYCMYEGVGQKLYSEHSIFSNSALATWVYLGLFSFYQTARMLFWYGRKFTKETVKLQNACKRSCKTLHMETLMDYEVNNKNTLDQKYAMKSSQYILSHSNHSEIVPKVFGIPFDNLTAKAALGLLMGTLPTIIKAMIDRASQK